MDSAPLGSQLCPLPCLPSLLLQEQPQWAGDTWRYIKRDEGNGKRPLATRFPEAVSNLSSILKQFGICENVALTFPAEHPIIHLSVTVPNTPLGSKTHHLKHRASQICFIPIPLQCPAKEKHFNEVIDLKTCFCGG